MNLPVDAVIAVTYRCDSRCNMCNIWQLPSVGEMGVDVFGRLPSTLRDVNITGGEPFLRDDIVDIIEAVYDTCKGPRIVISTNGFQKRRISHAAPKLMKIGRNVGIAVSVDGIGDMHDGIRGVEHGFDRVLETLKMLSKLRYRNVRIAFTAQRDNVKHLGAVYDLSRQFGFQFTTSVAQNSDFYFSTTANQRVEPLELEGELEHVMRKELISANPKRWLRAYFYTGVLKYNLKGERALECRAGRDSFYMDPQGNIYPCLTLDRKMGNLVEKSFDEIWKSEIADDVRGAVDRCGKPCWMICTARTSMARNPLKPARWIIGNWGRMLVGKGIRNT